MLFHWKLVTCTTTATIGTPAVISNWKQRTRLKRWEIDQIRRKKKLLLKSNSVSNYLRSYGQAECKNRTIKTVNHKPQNISFKDFCTFRWHMLSWSSHRCAANRFGFEFVDKKTLTLDLCSKISFLGIYVNGRSQSRIQGTFDWRWLDG